jgi:hypothetical protein
VQSWAPSAHARRGVAAALVLLCAGCAGTKPTRLTFDAIDSDRQYSPQFSRGYFTRTGDGGYDVILTEDGILPPQNKPGTPIAASATAPLRQTVHLRVLWRPLRGSRPDTPSAINSTVDWYVQTNSPTAPNDTLHYGGAGFVRVDGSGDKAQFMIRSAHVELKDGSGGLQDPLGPSTLSGTVVAYRNDGLVNAMLSDLDRSRTATNSANLHQGPPPRTPPGP